MSTPGPTALEAAFSELSNIVELPVRSGQKQVFSATYESKKVALKIIKRGVADLPRTQREIQAVATLRSKFVPQIITSGTRSVGGQEELFIVEQFIEGNSYREVLRDNPRRPLREV